MAQDEVEVQPFPVYSKRKVCSKMTGVSLLVCSKRRKNTTGRDHPVCSKRKHNEEGDFSLPLPNKNRGCASAINEGHTTIKKKGIPSLVDYYGWG
jgi:hypothetical protein